MANPISTARFVEELQKLKQEMDAGSLEHGEYDQRLSRIIHELRERGVEADRSGISAAIDQALVAGTITPGVKSHLQKRLGLA